MRKNKQSQSKKKKSKRVKNEANGLRGFMSNEVVQIRKISRPSPEDLSSSTSEQYPSSKHAFFISGFLDFQAKLIT